MDSQENFEAAREWCKQFYVFRRGFLLQVGIDKLLKAKYDEQQPSFGFKHVRRYLYYRTHRPWYQVLREQDAPRCNLRGKPLKNPLPKTEGVD
jgi:hypothetical protein